MWRTTFLEMFLPIPVRLASNVRELFALSIFILINITALNSWVSYLFHFDYFEIFKLSEAFFKYFKYRGICDLRSIILLSIMRWLLSSCVNALK